MRIGTGRHVELVSTREELKDDTDCQCSPGPLTVILFFLSSLPTQFERRGAAAGERRFREANGVLVAIRILCN